MPTRIVYGLNSLGGIDKFIKGRRTLLVTSQSFVARGLVDEIKSNTNNIVKVISNVKSHPEFKNLKHIYKKAREVDFDLILAIGGGSVIDVAKYISVCNRDHDYEFVEDLAKGRVSKSNYILCPIISVPTTAGTGSEITPYSTIWDMNEKKKYSLHLPDLFSELAIYDPVLTLTVPKNITIQTGLDTLSHALESIWNKNANPITIGYSIKAAKLIVDNLVSLSNNLNNIKYRDNVMKASMYAGLAFSNTQTSIAHAISYYITTHKGVEHGIACSFTLPMLIDKVIGKYTFIDKALIDIFGELSSNPLREILKKLEIPVNFSDYGLDNNEIDILKSSLCESQRISNSLIDF